MSFDRFRMLIILVMVGAISSIVTHALVFQNYQNAIGFFLIFLVTSVSLYKERRFSYLFIIASTTMYGALSFTLFLSTPGASLYSTIQYFGLFIVVGVLLSEISHRMKYLLPQLENIDLVDKATGTWNRRYILSLIRSNIEKHKRFETVFSVLKIKLDDSSLTDKQHKAAGRMFKESVRLIDEVGTIKKGLFALLLSETPREGAEAVASRLVQKLDSGVRDKVEVNIYVYPEEEERVVRFLESYDERKKQPLNKSSI